MCVSMCARESRLDLQSVRFWPCGNAEIRGKSQKVGSKKETWEEWFGKVEHTRTIMRKSVKMAGKGG